jgi:hypothetical protein
MFTSAPFRILVLAAALTSPALAGTALATGYSVVPGAVTSQRWTHKDSRTMLDGVGMTQIGETYLEQSGATGGGGQHS